MNKWLILVGFCAVLGSIGQLAFKKGSEILDFKNLFTGLNVWLITGLILYGLATLGYIVSLKRLDLTTAYPIISLSYLFVMILSLFFLHEKVTIINISGSLLLIVAVYLMVR